MDNALGQMVNALKKQATRYDPLATYIYHTSAPAKPGPGERVRRGLNRGVTSSERRVVQIIFEQRAPMAACAKGTPLEGSGENFEIQQFISCIMDEFESNFSSTINRGDFSHFLKYISCSRKTKSSNHIFFAKKGGPRLGISSHT